MTKRPSVLPHLDIVTDKPAAPAPVPTPSPAEKKMAGLRTSILFPRELHDVLRRIAFEERTTVTDLVMEGLDMALTRRGYPPTEKLGRKA
jgi:hypothetical protein